MMSSSTASTVLPNLPIETQEWLGRIGHAAAHAWSTAKPPKGAQVLILFGPHGDPEPTPVFRAMTPPYSGDHPLYAEALEAWSGRRTHPGASLMFVNEALYDYRLVISISGTPVTEELLADLRCACVQAAINDPHPVPA